MWQTRSAWRPLYRTRRNTSARLKVELMERRVLLSAWVDDHAALLEAPPTELATVVPRIVAGSPDVEPPDSPADRVDPNTTDSPFAGVGSLFMQANRVSGYICTGTLVSPTHVVTAAHCLDKNNDGRVDFKPNRVQFILNYGGDMTHVISAKSLTVHPDFTGFARPSVNDDIAVVTLNSAAPQGVPVYPLYTGSLLGQTLTLVGYGETGTPDGYIAGSASLTVKRVGQNVVGAIEGQDDSGKAAADEVWLGDFDPAPNGPDTLGDGPTLGNTLETTLGGGDSGGPGFVEINGQLYLASVNTFTTTDAPAWGSLLGGINVSAYASWIEQVIQGGDGGGGNNGGKGGGKGGGRKPRIAETEGPVGVNGADSYVIQHSLPLTPSAPQRDTTPVQEDEPLFALGPVVDEVYVTPEPEADAVAAGGTLDYGSASTAGSAAHDTDNQSTDTALAEILNELFEDLNQQLVERSGDAPNGA